MGFLSNFYNRLHPAPPPRDVTTIQTRVESERAVVSAEITYQQRMEKGTEVHELVTKLQKEREKNHFGEMLEKTMRGADNATGR